MRDIALYYPYIHIRDDAWLKAAALYWPKIARLTPRDYPRHDSETARKLSGELGFIVNIEPKNYTRKPAQEFTEFIRGNRGALQRRYILPRRLTLEDNYVPTRSIVIDALANGLQLPQPDYAAVGPGYAPSLDPPPHAHDGNPNLGWIHIEKMNYDLVNELEGSRLGIRADSDWIVVAPALASVYTAALAEEVANSNDLAVVTDRPSAYGILNGWDTETLAQALLGDDPKDEPALKAEEIGALYAAVAIKTVIPAGIADIPVEKIIKARRSLAQEFDTFRDHLNTLTDRLAELGQIKDPSVLQARLELMIDRDLRRPAGDLEQKLRQLGFEPEQAVLGMKSLELPAAAAAAASALALPPGAGQAGMVAARLIATAARSRAQRRQMLRSTPAGYLLSLEKQLTPGGIIERLRRTLLRTRNNTRLPAARRTH